MGCASSIGPSSPIDPPILPAPIAVVCFNTAQGWSRDASEMIAQELRPRCDPEGRELPGGAADFVVSNERPRQLTLQLA
jgi:hypothetical protein